jgi:hypothetical protein
MAQGGVANLESLSLVWSINLFHIHFFHVGGKSIVILPKIMVIG